MPPPPPLTGEAGGIALTGVTTARQARDAGTSLQTSLEKPNRSHGVYMTQTSPKTSTMDNPEQFDSMTDPRERLDLQLQSQSLIKGLSPGTAAQGLGQRKMGNQRHHHAQSKQIT